MTKTARIESILLERYACQEVPQGHLTMIAEEVGCTRELVRQVRNKLGMDWVSARPIKVCASCGKEMEISTSNVLCNSCRWIDLVCGHCDKKFRRLATDVVRNANQPGATGQLGGPFCSRRCSVEAAKEWGFTRYAGKPLAGHGTRACYRRGCRCRPCTDANAAYARARYRRRREA